MCRLGLNQFAGGWRGLGRMVSVRRVLVFWPPVAGDPMALAASSAADVDDLGGGAFAVFVGC